MDFRYLGFFVLVFFASSCAQLTHLETARTNGKGNVKIAGLFAGYGAGGDQASDINVGLAPHFQAQVSYGLFKPVDIGMSASTSANINLYTKIKILGDDYSNFALALLPGFEYQYASEEKVYRVPIGVVGSFHPSDNFAFSVEPKLILQPIEGSRTSFPGVTGALHYTFNNDWTMSLGYSYFGVRQKDLSSRDNLYQVSLGANKIISF